MFSSVVGKPYQPEVYSPQQETASIISKEVPVAAPHPKPKGKGEKSEKGDKSEKSDKGKEKSQPSPEPPASQEVSGLLGNSSAAAI